MKARSSPRGRGSEKPSSSLRFQAHASCARYGLVDRKKETRYHEFRKGFEFRPYVTKCRNYELQLENSNIFKRQPEGDSPEFFVVIESSRRAIFLNTLREHWLVL